MITIARKQQIYNLIKEKELWDKTFDDIVALQQDIVLKVMDFSTFTTEVLTNASGFIFFNKDENKFYIGVNAKSGEKRQRFTIAHELGHYFLHQDVLKEDKPIIDGGNASYLFQNHGQVYSQVSEEYRIREEEANEFAAELLMPQKSLRDVYSKFKEFEEDVSIQKLSDIFNVSVPAMTFRLINLGLISND